MRARTLNRIGPGKHSPTLRTMRKIDKALSSELRSRRSRLPTGGNRKIPFAPDHIKKFAARSAIGKKRKSPKC
jgi:hypothetical protein